jgi:hypothetical protein
MNRKKGLTLKDERSRKKQTCITNIPSIAYAQGRHYSNHHFLASPPYLPLATASLGKVVFFRKKPWMDQHYAGAGGNNHKTHGDEHIVAEASDCERICCIEGVMFLPSKPQVDHLV